MYKGIFRAITDAPEAYLLTVKVPCGADGTSLDAGVTYSSKSGENFNHEAEWSKLPRKVTRGLPFTHYPRGRVEVRHGKTVVYLNPDINRAPWVEMIRREFGIGEARFISDGSRHYRWGD